MLKTNAMRILDTAKTEYKSYEYSPTDGIDAVSVAKYIGKPTEQTFKTLVTQSPTSQHGFNYFVFVIPADSELSVKKAALAAGVKNIEMIPLKKLLPLTGYVHGGCSPLGMKKVFTTVIDISAKEQPIIIFSAGKIGYQIETTLGNLSKVLKYSLARITL